MAEVNFSELAKQMLEAAVAVLGPEQLKVHGYAGQELGKIADTVGKLEGALASKQLSEQQAQLLLEMQRNASISVLATVKGMEIVAAEKAVNAALAVGRTALERTLGIRLV